MIKKVTLTQVWKGKQLVKKGTPDEREIDKVSIKTEEFGDNWLTTFYTRGTNNFEEGKEVYIEVEKNGQYYNFKPVSSTEVRLRRLEDAVFGKEENTEEHTEKKANQDTPPEVDTHDDINPDDILL